MALQKKLEIKDELTKELASKADILFVRQEMQTIKTELEGKIENVRTDLEGKIGIVKADIKRLDMKLNFMIVLMIIALTLMNPVMAEIIKGIMNLK